MPGFAVRDPEHRIDQPCHECQTFDKHPRHNITFVDPDTGAMQEVLRHMDCCAAAGCPDGSCDKILEEARKTGDHHGDKLIAFTRKLQPGEHASPVDPGPDGGTL
jgi:hypothetical protein